MLQRMVVRFDQILEELDGLLKFFPLYEVRCG